MGKRIPVHPDAPPRGIADRRFYFNVMTIPTVLEQRLLGTGPTVKRWCAYGESREDAKRRLGIQ